MKEIMDLSIKYHFESFQIVLLGSYQRSLSSSKWDRSTEGRRERTNVYYE